MSGSGFRRRTDASDRDPLPALRHESGGTDDGRAWLTAAMELSAAVDFAQTTRQSVLTTIRGNGRPQLSNVFHYVSDDGVIRISITADRAKYHNLSREPWAALHVTRGDFFAYVVLEGAVELAPVASRPDDSTVDELVLHYRALIGEHEDWDAYRKAMVAERRSVVRFTPNRAYGMLDLPSPSGS
jgi:PPOX class probable F420-dependent enzyme